MITRIGLHRQFFKKISFCFYLTNAVLLLILNSLIFSNSAKSDYILQKFIVLPDEQEASVGGGGGNNLGHGIQTLHDLRHLSIVCGNCPLLLQ